MILADHDLWFHLWDRTSLLPWSKICLQRWALQIKQITVCGLQVQENLTLLENFIQQRTGHCSIKALHTYQRTTGDQELAVIKILISESNWLLLNSAVCSRNLRNLLRNLQHWASYLHLSTNTQQSPQLDVEAVMSGGSDTIICSKSCLHFREYS